MVKIGIYSVALNEAKFAERWAKSTIDADYRLVLDTGSTDHTPTILQANGVIVAKSIIRPWRFDDARNVSLHLLPADLDIIICLDLDETFCEGWRQNIERSWTEKTTRLRYQYTWSWTATGERDLIYYADKICGRFTHRWRAPVHEVLTPTVPEVMTTCEAMLIEHHADPTKSRSQYLHLLELAVKETPDDDRNSHYLGREYYYHRQWKKAITELERHLWLPKALWKAERAASMRYIAKCHEGLGDVGKARAWYIKAVLEEPSSREALIDLGKFCLEQHDFYLTIGYCQRALRLPSYTGDYMAERYARAEGANDLMAVAYWNVGQFDIARDHARAALTFNPTDPRLINNLAMMQKE